MTTANEYYIFLSRHIATHCFGCANNKGAPKRQPLNKKVKFGVENALLVHVQHFEISCKCRSLQNTILIYYMTFTKACKQLKEMLH
jgi:hypothetical protein